MGTGPGETVLLMAGRESVGSSAVLKVAQEDRMTKINKNSELGKDFFIVAQPLSLIHI